MAFSNLNLNDLMAQRELLDPPFSTIQFLHKRCHEAADKMEVNPSFAQKQFCLTSRFTQRPYNIKNSWSYYFSINADGISIMTYYMFCLEEFLLAAKLFIDKVRDRQGDLGVQSSDPDMMWLHTMIDDALTARLIVMVKEFYYRDYSKYESMHDLNNWSGFREEERNKLKKELDRREKTAREKSRAGEQMTAEEVRILENLRHRDNKDLVTMREMEGKESPGQMLIRHLKDGNAKWGSQSAAEDRKFWVKMMKDKQIRVDNANPSKTGSILETS